MGMFRRLALTLVFAISAPLISFAEDTTQIKGAYVGPNGNTIVHLNTRPGDEEPRKDILWNCRNGHCYELVASRFENPYNNKLGGFSIRQNAHDDQNGGHLVLDSKTGTFTLKCGTDDSLVTLRPLSLQDAKKLVSDVSAKKIQLHPRPEHYRKQMFFKSGKDKYVYVDFSLRSEKLRVFIGNPGNMKELKLSKLRPLESGGDALVLEDGSEIIDFGPFGSLTEKGNNFELEPVNSPPFNLSDLKIPGVPSSNLELPSPCRVESGTKREGETGEKAKTSQ